MPTSEDYSSYEDWAYASAMAATHDGSCGHEHDGWGGSSCTECELGCLQCGQE